MLGDINEYVRDQIDREDFEGDEDEYAEFYGKAMKILDKYGYVRAAYEKVDPSARGAKLGQNEFPQAVQNADLFVEQRWKCIEALRDLHDKLSSELELFTVRARLGIAQVPSDRGLFFGLTVAEHFRLDGLPHDCAPRYRSEVTVAVMADLCMSLNRHQAFCQVSRSRWRVCQGDATGIT